MDQLQDRLKTLKQMRLTQARLATGERDDPATVEFIRLHAAVSAIEAAIEEGASTQVDTLDLAGFELDVQTFKFDAVADTSQPVLELDATMPGPLGDFSFWEAHVTNQGRHTWFAAWDAAVRRGGYRIRVAAASPQPDQVQSTAAS